MQLIWLALLLFFLAAPAEAQIAANNSNGTFTPLVSLQYPTTFSFRDSYGYNFASNFGWKAAQIVASNRFVAIGTGAPSNFPLGALQITVQPGDNPLLPGCPSCHERNEVYEWTPPPLGGDEQPGNTAFYAESIWIPSDFQNDGGVSSFGFFWNIINQLHTLDTDPCGGISPEFAICLSCGNPPDGDAEGVPATHLIFDVRGGECSGTPTRNIVDLGTRVTAQRIDILFEAHWAADNTGYIKTYTRVGGVGALRQVQLDGVTPIPQLNAPNLYSSGGVASAHNYMKRGMYRDGGAGYNTVYYAGPFVRAPTFEAAAIAAFGQYP